MSMNPRYKIVLHAAFLSIQAHGAFAQGLNWSQVVWSHGKKIEIDGRHLVLSPTISVEREREVDLPPSTVWASWRNEGIYALVVDAAHPSEKERLVVLMKPTGSPAWKTYAHLPDGLEGIRAAIPTADGKLFLVPNGAFVHDPTANKNDLKAWSPFLILGKDGKGDWTELKPINLDWGPPFLTPLGPDGKPAWSKTTRRYSFLSSARIETPNLQDRLFELEDGWALVDRHHAMIWVFDSNGVLKRHISTYASLKDEDLDLPLMAFPTAVVACESAPDGKLILAIRNDIAFFFSRKTWPVAHDPQTQTPASDYLWRQGQAAKDFPEIAWKVVDTQSGEVHTIPSPAGLPSKFVFRPEDPNWTFRFQVGSDGQVISAIQGTQKPIPGSH